MPALTPNEQKILAVLVDLNRPASSISTATGIALSNVYRPLKSLQESRLISKQGTEYVITPRGTDALAHGVYDETAEEHILALTLKRLEAREELLEKAFDKYERLFDNHLTRLTTLARQIELSTTERLHYEQLVKTHLIASSPTPTPVAKERPPRKKDEQFPKAAYNFSLYVDDSGQLHDQRPLTDELLSKGIPFIDKWVKRQMKELYPLCKLADDQPYRCEGPQDVRAQTLCNYANQLVNKLVQDAQN